MKPLLLRLRVEMCQFTRLHVGRRVGDATCIAFSPRDNVLACAVRQNVFVWRTDRNREPTLLQTITDASHPSQSLCFDSTGDVLFTGSKTGVISKFDRGQQQARRPAAAAAAAAAADGAAADGAAAAASSVELL